MRYRLRRHTPLLGTALVALVVGSALSATAPAALGATAGAQALSPLRRLGSVNLRIVASTSRPSETSRAVPDVHEIGGIEIPKPGGALRPEVLPNPSPTPLDNDTPGVSGFDGISHRDHRRASGGNQQSLEPPDQGLCVGNGHVVEAVNLAIAVYSANSFAVEVPTTGLNAFFGLPPMVDRQADPIIFGPFLSDPRCYFDVQTQRFFLTVLEIDRDGLTGDIGSHAATLLAVSQSNDPTAGWALFSADATDDGSNGTPAHPNCPCLGDQPVLGADANGIYFSTNEYSLEPFGTFFNGAQIYAVSKRGLAAAAMTSSGALPPLVHLEAGNLGMSFPPVDGIPAAIASVQPASTPPGAAYARDVEFFLSSFDVNVNKSDQRLALWALSNTHTLDTAAPDLRLTAKVLATEPYVGGPPAGTPVQQKPGPRPLGESLGEPLPTVNAGDDRMQAPTYVNGRLYAVLTTRVGQGNRVVRTGTAWFILQANAIAGRVDGAVTNQGYVAAPNGTSLMYPAVALDQTGRGVIALSLVGPDNHPSAGYVAFGGLGPSGPVHIVRAGVAPEDGFTCYVALGNAPPCRWGDYSSAVADEAGNLWMAAEDIPGPRTSLANWGSFVARLSSRASGQR